VLVEREITYIYVDSFIDISQNCRRFKSFVMFHCIVVQQFPTLRSYLLHFPNHLRFPEDEGDRSYLNVGKYLPNDAEMLG